MKSKNIVKKIKKQGHVRAIFTTRAELIATIFVKQKSKSLYPKLGFTGTAVYHSEGILFEPDEKNAFIMNIPSEKASTLHIPSFRHYVY